LTDADFTALGQRILNELDGRPLWIFALSSLIWNPAFTHVEARRVRAMGWRRAFCLHMLEWRGTPEAPGLMLALDRGGSCTGMAFRLPDQDLPAQIDRLLRREYYFKDDPKWMRWLTLRDAQGAALPALGFYCAAPGVPNYVALPLELQADHLATGVGPAGSCAEYLYNTVLHLEHLGIHDSYLWRLQQLVAKRIAGA
jgi:cation transport protein ChaC